MYLSCPPRLAFQLFAGQTIQLLYFCTKNKVVVVVVVVTTEQVQGIAKPAVNYVVLNRAKTKPGILSLLGEGQKANTVILWQAG